MKGRLIITNHANERIKENGLTVLSVNRMWQLSRPVKTPKGRRQYKIEKYGAKNLFVDYFWCNGFLFTVNRKGKENVLITITKQSLFSLKLR